MKRFLALVIFALPSLCHTQSCTTASCIAASCSPTAILAALPSSRNTNSTVTVSIPDCTSSNVQTTPVTYAQPSAVTSLTIAGTGTPNSGASTTGAASSCTQTQLVDNTGSGINYLFYFTLVYGQTLRVSCMDIEPYSTTAQLTTPILVEGTCTSSGCPQLRIDNITFGYTTPWVENNNGSAASWMTRTDDVFGVMDHNTIPSGSQTELSNNNFSAYLGVGQYGDNSWAQPDSFGTANNMFYENNIWHTISNGGMSMIDSDVSDGSITSIGGARGVCRYNTVTVDSGGQGIGVCAVHGTENTGRPRSGRELEIYNNTINCLVPNYCSAIDGGTTRGGTSMLFNNQANLAAGSIWFAFSPYRVDSGEVPWGYCGGSGPYDQNDGINYVSPNSTLTSASGGGGSGSLTVGDTTRSWTTNQWVPTGGPYSFYDVTQGFWIEIASNTSNTLTTTAETGGLANYRAAIGDTYTIQRASLCIDQPGRGAGTYLSGTTPSPAGSVNDALDPIYQWNDTATGASIYAPGWISISGKILVNRDFYPQASGPQTSATSPFNGTSGTGWGTLANRPTTCTTGVGYAEYSGGNFVQLDKCTATNTWTNGVYTPYTYPHPLTTCSTKAAPCPPRNTTGTPYLTGTP